MSGYESEELPRIEAALDDLVSPTSEDVWQALRPYDERAIASVAAKRASGDGGSQPVLVTTATLTNAQIITLPTTRVVVVAAPGSGKLLHYLGGLAVLDNTAGVYGNVASTDDSPSNPAVIRINNGGWIASVLGDVDWLLGDGSEAGVLSLSPYADDFTAAGQAGGPLNPEFYHPLDGWSDYRSAIENKPLSVVCFNGYGSSLGNFTGGDPTNTLKVTLFYAVVDL